MQEIAGRPLIEQAIARTQAHIRQIHAAPTEPVSRPEARRVPMRDLLDIERRVLATLQDLFINARGES